MERRLHCLLDHHPLVFVLAHLLCNYYALISVNLDEAAYLQYMSGLVCGTDFSLKDCPVETY